jgi:hypothetical protein
MPWQISERGFYWNLFGSGMVNFDGRESIVMHAHDLFALEKVSGTDGVIDIHGQSAADAQDGE